MTFRPLQVVFALLCLLLVVAPGACASGQDAPGGSVPGRDAGVDSDGAGTEGGGAEECVPKTCADLGASCGQAPDTCGGVVDCGTCLPGETCGGDGPNVCGSGSCAPKTCVQAGASCGIASDGCAAVIDCGGCTPPQVCGTGSDLNRCVCVPKTCAQLGANCGIAPDGCGGTLDCGSCPAGETCGGSGPNQCGTGSCVAKTCAQLGASCGLASDECSNVVDCGDCTAPSSCGGGGVENQCGCFSKTCAQLGLSCGSEDDGCGNTLDCGQCSLAHATAGCNFGICTITGCDSGFEDCNGSATDGCEANLAIDPNNCNACGTVCDAPSGTPVCEAGVCGVSNCPPGEGDCDKDPGNGCEIDLTTDAGNCGACTNACSFANASATCQAGVCVLGTCDPARGNCDGNDSNGCETDLDTRVAHCGACGNACPTRPNSTPTCAGGSCGIQCNAGFANCDGDPSNGCEVDLGSDASNCGACGNACNTTGGSPTCSGGTCGIQCSPGFGDCDGNAANGCEVNLDTTVTHCGACGNACSSSNGTPSCAGGNCSISCDLGFGDCNGDVNDGCEVDLDRTEAHCGTCGNDCNSPAPPNTTDRSCSGGTCAIAACSGGYYDQNGTYSDGCECQSDGIANACGSAASLGSVAINGSGGVSGNNITPSPGDDDWYRITFTSTPASCNFNPKIVLNDSTGMLRMRVYTNCSSGTIPCGSGNSGQAITTWEFTYSGACGDQKAADPTPATGGFVTIPTTVYVRVYSTGSHSSCLGYSLTVTN